MKNTKKKFFVNVCCVLVFCMFLCCYVSVFFCAGHFVMVPMNLTCLYCLQHSFFEHLLNLYDNDILIYWECIMLKAIFQQTSC